MTKEQYWKYALIIFVICLGAVIFVELLPFLSGILGAITLYVLVRPQMFYLVEKKRFKKSIAATLIIIEVVLCILIPTFLAVWLLLGKINSIELAPSSIISTIQNYTDLFKEKTSYDLFSSENISSITTYATRVVQIILGQISSFLIQSLVLIFVLYFMLVSCRPMESYLIEILPFSTRNKKDVLKETKMMVRSNAIGVPLLAVIQGAIATIGYIIFGVPDPVLFGFLTCFATILPLIGTALIWFPLAAYLAVMNHWPSAIGLAVYALVVISNIDNLVRFMLQKKMADTHPLITVFGVIIGLTLFGFWGVIFGPLLLSMFILLFNMFKKEYLDKDK